MNTALAVQIDGLYVPLTECDWVMFRGCGCPTGVGLAALGADVFAADEDTAWKSVFDCNKRERAKREKEGYRLELMTHRRCCDGPLKQLTEPCTHKGLDIRPSGALL